MIFLIHFDRTAKLLVRFTTYQPHEREIARRDRSELESRSRANGRDDEIVTLEAPSIEALRRTHSRYFNYLDAGHTTITRYGEVSTPPLAVRERPPTDAD